MQAQLRRADLICFCSDYAAWLPSLILEHRETKESRNSKGRCYDKRRRSVRWRGEENTPALVGFLIGKLHMCANRV